MARPIELPVRVLALTVLAAGAIGGGQAAAVLVLTDWARGRRT